MRESLCSRQTKLRRHLVFPVVSGEGMYTYEVLEGPRDIKDAFRSSAHDGHWLWSIE